MNTLVDRARAALFRDGFIVVTMEERRGDSISRGGKPAAGSRHSGAAQQLELPPFGLHWPDLDEDLSFRGLAQGVYGQRSR